MRYYTKEWFMLMQQVGLSGNFKKLPQKDYTTAEIKKLYEKKLKKEIGEGRKSYEEEPFFPLEDELLPDGAFDPADWLIVDEESGEARRPANREEMLAHLNEEHRQIHEAFMNKPPFDPAESIEIFRKIYRSNLKTCVSDYPEWMTRTVDHRLIALGYLPEDAYLRYKEELRQTQKRWNALNRAAERAERRAQIPEQVAEALYLHDASLLSVREKGNDLIMTVKKDGMWPEDSTPYRSVVFKSAVILEKDEGLKPRKTRGEDGIYSSGIWFLYHELYEKKGVYEAHMLFDSPGGLCYLTVKCDAITFADGVEVR